MQPWVEGQTATVRFYRHGHKLRVVNVNLTMSATGKSGMALVRLQDLEAGAVEVHATHLATPTAPQLVANAGEGQRRGAARAPGRARPRRAPAPAAPGGQGLRRRAARPLRRPHRARRPRLPQGHRHGAHDHRRHRPVQGRAGRQGHASRCAIPTTASTSRPTSRARSSRSSSGSRVRAHLPGELGQALDADRSRAASASTRKSPGFNAKGMYYSNYFIRGFAIHGYAEVPVFAASHGCLRIPIPDARLDLPLDQDRRHRRRLPVGRLGLGHEQVEQRRHPAAGVGGALAVGPLPSARIRSMPSSASPEPSSAACGRARSSAARATSGAGRSAPSMGSRARSPSRAAVNDASMSTSRGVQASRPLLRLGARQAVHERGQAGRRPQRRLAVHRAHLDRAQARVRADVPPQEGVVGQVAGRDDARDALGVVVEGGEGARDLGARIAAEELRARASRGPSRGRARRASWRPAPAAAAAARAAR